MLEVRSFPRNSNDTLAHGLVGRFYLKVKVDPLTTLNYITCMLQLTRMKWKRIVDLSVEKW